MEKRDLVIVGGGASGFGAAYNALLCGNCHVTLIEKNQGLGGTSTYGGVNCWEPGIGGHGVHRLLAQRLLAQNAAFVGYRSDSGVTSDAPWGISSRCSDSYDTTLRRGMLNDYEARRFHFEPAAMAVQMRQLLMEADLRQNRLELLLQSEVVGVESLGRQIQSLQVRTPIGLRTFAPSLVIDCSGELTVARGAGCAVAEGAEAKAQYQEPSAPEHSNSHLNGITQVFRVTPAESGFVQFIPSEYADVNLNDWLEQLEQTRRPLSCFNYYPNGDLNINMLPTIEGDVLRQLPYSELSHVCQARAYAYWNWVTEKRHFGSYRICEMFPMLGIRESYRLVGRYVLTEQDLLLGYAKSLGENHTVAYADHPADLHGAKSSLHPFRAYGIPYECMLPREIDNLLVACRGASFSHIAASSVRLTRTMMALGEAAGTAAAQCLQRGIAPYQVDLPALRKNLGL